MQEVHIMQVFINKEPTVVRSQSEIKVTTTQNVQ